MESVNVYENNMRDILSYDNKNDIYEYRKGCANRFDSIKNILKINSLSIKKNKYLNDISNLINKYEEKDIETILDELINQLSNLKKDTFNVSIKSCITDVGDEELKVYEKIIEFAIQYRLQIAKINYFYLDKVSINRKKPYTIKITFNKIKK